MIMGVVNNRIMYERFIAESVSEFFFKSVNIWQSYKQEGSCLMHFVRQANALLKDEESVRDHRVLACNFAKYSLILLFFHWQT